MSTKSDLIRAAIAERYPCQALPYGTETTLAKEFGCTRQLVSLVKNGMGYGGYVLPVKPKRLCADCGEAPVITRSDYCKEHMTFELPCAQCGEPVKVQRAHYDWTRAKNPRYTTGNVFCNYTCNGAYAGRHYGWGDQKHPVHGKRSPKTHCKRGHPLSGDNLYTSPQGQRRCKTCDATRNQQYYAAKKAAAHA